METSSQPDSGTPTSSPLQGFNPDFPKIIDRLKKLVLDTDNAWTEIKAENIDVRGLYMQYLLVVAAVTPVSDFIGGSILGDVGFGTGLFMMIKGYLVTLVAAYVWALIAQKVATYFEGNCTLVDSLKWVTFSMFPSQFIGIVGIIPSGFIQMLRILGLFAIYVAWLGVPKLTGVSEAKRPAFFITLIGISVVLAIIIMALIWPAAAPAPAYR